MKKIALIMLAIVSMALASCGGGGGIKPTSPDILYKGDGSKLDGYFKVKEVSARVEGENEITATAILEVVKDIPEMSYELFEKKRVYEHSYGFLSLFDKDMMKMGDDGNKNEFSILNKEKGETITISSKIETDMPSSEAIKKIKFIQVTIDGLYAW